MISPDLQQHYAHHLFQRVDNFHRAMADTIYEQLVIDVGGARYRFLDDTSYPFRPNPYATRLAPLHDFPDSFIIISSGVIKPQLLVYQPKDYWHAVTTLNCEAITSQFHVTVYADKNKLWSDLPNHLHVAYLGDRPELLSAAAANPPELINYLDFQQAVKTEYEVHCIARANTLAVKGHAAVAQLFGGTTSELALHLAYLAAIKATENTLPYDNIIAGNENAAILHYTHHSTETAALRSLLIDAGATYNGYCADISRTYCRHDGLFSELITRLDGLQQNLCAQVAPGVEYVDIHRAAFVGIGEILVETGIITCPLEQAIEDNIVGVFFPHGVGHLLGVQVHDRGGWQADISGVANPPPAQFPFLRMTRQIASNQVFTIEPGIYFIDQLLTEAEEDGRGQQINQVLIQELKPFGGIRIEDNLRVTETGNDNLTRQAFAELT